MLAANFQISFISLFISEASGKWLKEAEHMEELSVSVLSLICILIMPLFVPIVPLKMI